MSEDTAVATRAASELNRLRWRCRRGMRELDQLLTRYLEHAWPDDSERQRGVFLKLLDCEDDRLWDWFMGHEVPADAEIAALVARIRELPPRA
jgi:antitoxin CptB